MRRSAERFLTATVGDWRAAGLEQVIDGPDVNAVCDAFNLDLENRQPEPLGSGASECLRDQRDRPADEGSSANCTGERRFSATL